MMNRNKYNKLINDSTVFKFDAIGGCFFKDMNNEVVIQFIFMHNGELNNFSSKPTKRIFLSTFPAANLLEGIPTKFLNSNATLLANADIYEYALAYNIYNDINRKTVEVKLIDKPEIGEGFILRRKLMA